SQTTSLINSITQQTIVTLSDYSILFDEFINSTKCDIIFLPIESIAKELNIQENLNKELTTNQQDINQQKNKYFINQIKNDLEHKIEDQ
ncbi:10332_t:CDS:1, partial [Racocetra persica]